MRNPIWKNPPADIVLLSGTIDELTFRHLRERMELALSACVDLKQKTNAGSYASSENHVLFSGSNGVEVTLKPFTDSLSVIVTAPGFSLSLKMPPDRSGADMGRPEVIASIIGGALASMDAHVVRSAFSMGTGNDSEELIAGMTPEQRHATTRALETSCAIIAAANPNRSPYSMLRIQLAHPGREARIVDRKSASLFRKNVEKRLVQGLPSVIGLSSSTHGYVDFEPAQVSIRQKDAALDAMSIIRLISQSGIDATDAVLSAATTD